VKKWTEYTDRELCDLDLETVEKLVQLECLERGIVPVTFAKVQSFDEFLREFQDNKKKETQVRL
jgi:hypothetical protein